MSLSTECLVYVFKIKLLSSPNPCFVLHVQHMPSIWFLTLTKLAKKWRTKLGQMLDLTNLPIYNLVTLQLDKIWTNSGPLEIHSLTTFCPTTYYLSFVQPLSNPLNKFLTHGPRPAHTLHIETDYGLSLDNNGTKSGQYL